MSAVIFPDGLGDMLRDFVVAVIRQKPEDIYEFAADFFVYIRDKHRMKNVPMYVFVEHEEEACEPDPAFFHPKIQKIDGSLRSQRRRSIAAEKYDPEVDAEEQLVVYPKSSEQKERLIQGLKSTILFHDFDSDQLQVISDCMFLRSVEAGQKVINEGDIGDNFYVIDNGIFDVHTNKGDVHKLVHSYNNNGCFGELALMHNQPRSATVIAKTTGCLWVMEGKHFRELVMKITFKKRKMYEGLIKSVPILNDLDENERMNLSDSLVTQKFKDNECIIKEGDEAEGMYFIESGLVRVTIKKGEYEAEVSRISAGKYFGEMALVEKKPRSASVYAVGSVKLAFLKIDSFERLLGPCFDVMKRAMSKYES